ncbi:hypothetical protein APHAL10511_003027 [Amanita phalloides]|nr:hypothetical protein APHAL10511_003027 [Amanita phalloides]
MLPRKIGNSIIPAIGFGTGGLGVAGYGPLTSFEDRVKIFDFLYEAGCTHWDTAEVYGEGEALIGEWLRRTGKRSEVFIATKFGYTHEWVRGDAEYVKEAAERSLRTLGVDYIDLYYQHRPDPNTPIELTIKAMAELVKDGKIKHIGLSDPSVETLRRAHATHPIAAIQVEFSPLVLDATQPPHDLIQAAKELGVAVIVYSPLARGFITGRFTSLKQLDPTDYRLQIARYSEKNIAGILDTVSQIESIGKKHIATAAQVTLAWALAQGDNFFVIPGAKDVKRIQENLGSLKVKLSAEEVEEMWNIARNANKVVTGDRDIPWGVAAAYTDTPVLMKS